MELNNEIDFEREDYTGPEILELLRRGTIGKGTGLNKLKFINDECITRYVEITEDNIFCVDGEDDNSPYFLDISDLINFEFQIIRNYLTFEELLDFIDKQNKNIFSEVLFKVEADNINKNTIFTMHEFVKMVSEFLSSIIIADMFKGRFYIVGEK